MNEEKKRMGMGSTMEPMPTSGTAGAIESHRRGCTRFCKTLSFCRESHWEALPDGTKRHLRCNCDGPHRAQWLLDLIRAAQGECFQGDWTPINDATKDFEGRPGKEGIPPISVVSSPDQEPGTVSLVQVKDGKLIEGVRIEGIDDKG